MQSQPLTSRNFCVSKVNCSSETSKPILAISAHICCQFLHLVTSTWPWSLWNDVMVQRGKYPLVNMVFCEPGPTRASEVWPGDDARSILRESILCILHSVCSFCLMSSYTQLTCKPILFHNRMDSGAAYCGVSVLV